MSSKVASNAWSEILHHEADGILELRWLPVEMTDGGFKATLALFAWQAEQLRPTFLLIDATKFQHRFGPNVMQWRDDSITRATAQPAPGSSPSMCQRDFRIRSRPAARRLLRGLQSFQPHGSPNVRTRSIGSAKARVWSE